MGFLEIAYECKGESYGGCCSKEGVSGGGAFVSSCRETAEGQGFERKAAANYFRTGETLGGKGMQRRKLWWLL
jgi:hypothetical protein